MDATGNQLTRIERTLTDHKLYGGDYDRLWKLLQMARLHEADPGDGAPIPAAQASAIITWLDGRGYGPPKTARRAYPKIPEGRYATATGPGGKLQFWLVEVPATGRWAGYSFVSQVIGGQPPQDVRGDPARAALEAIEAAGIVPARETYARELQECWACGTHLSDDLSREVLIGPDCCKRRLGMTQRQYRAELAKAA
jgi:hypothetical protein